MYERISDRTIQQVKDYSGIVDFIQQYVDLKKRGQNYIGLCPFHGEKTPSFTVSPTKQIFHCFGCHESGDLISFVQKIDNLTFYEAIEVIANFANIDVVREHVSNEQKRRYSQLETILMCLKQANDVFISMFKQSSFAQDYCLNRHISKESLDKFSIGFCESSKQLQDTLGAASLSQDKLLASGLFSKGQTGLYCRFQKRLIFPILDFQSRVVGFGGRLLENDAKGAKYVNSEESAWFNKRNLLYGLSYAKQAIKQKGYVLLVEGYLDVIMCSQFGFDNVVACMGTSLTANQVKLLKRVTQHVVVMFDHDNAGKEATKKSIALLLGQSMQVDIAVLDSLDPADFLVKHGASALENKLKLCISAFEFFYMVSKQHLDLSNINNVSSLISQVLPILKCITDDVVRSHYICMMARDLKINEEVIVAKMDELLYNKSQDYSIEFNISNVGKNKYQKAEETILAIVCVNRDLRDYLKGIDLTIFTTPLTKRLTEYVIQSNDMNGVLLEHVPQDMKSYLASLLIISSQYDGNIVQRNVVLDCLNVLSEQKFTKDINDLKDKLKVYEESGNEAELEKVMAELDKKQKGGIYEYKY